MSLVQRELLSSLRKEESVFVVWDVQRALVDAVFNREEFLKGIGEALSVAREAKLPVFYTAITPLPPRFENPFRRTGGWNPGEIIEEVKPQKGDIVIHKNTTSIFVGTNFEIMLRYGGFKNIFFSGIATEIGVETSVRHAQALGFLPIVVKEAVSSRNREAHERSLANLSLYFPVISVSEMKSLLNK